MCTCAINDELLTVIGNSHAEVISNGFVKVESRRPAKCSSQLFAHLLLS
jgi:hypothetical protein